MEAAFLHYGAVVASAQATTCSNMVVVVFTARSAKSYILTTLLTQSMNYPLGSGGGNSPGLQYTELGLQANGLYSIL